MRADQMVAPVFVVLWSTGFLGAKLGLPYAEPMTFLALRFGLVAAILAAWVVIAGAPWPNRRQFVDQVIIGILVHFLYLGGVFTAISFGIEAGLSALIVGLQPILTALIARQVLSERLGPVQWTGMALGLAGVALVVARKLGDGLGDGLGVALCFGGLIGISVGSILQKLQASGTPMRGGNAIQFAAASICCAVTAAIFETGHIQWTGAFVFALVWLIVILSLGAITMLYILIQRGGASNVASLFFLVPPCTALFAWAMFGETLGPVEAGGVLVTALGVLMVNRPALFSGR